MEISNKTYDTKTKMTSSSPVLQIITSSERSATGLQKENAHGASWKVVVSVRQNLKSTFCKFREVVEFVKNTLREEREVEQEYVYDIEETNWKFSVMDPCPCFVFKSVKELLHWRSFPTVPQYVFSIGYINRQSPGNRYGLWLSSKHEARDPFLIPVVLPAIEPLLQLPGSGEIYIIVYGQPIMYPPNYTVNLRVVFVREIPFFCLERYEAVITRRYSL